MTNFFLHLYGLTSANCSRVLLVHGVKQSVAFRAHWSSAKQQQRATWTLKWSVRIVNPTRRKMSVPKKVCCTNVSVIGEGKWSHYRKCSPKGNSSTAILSVNIFSQSGASCTFQCFFNLPLNLLKHTALCIHTLTIELSWKIKIPEHNKICHWVQTIYYEL